MTFDELLKGLKTDLRKKVKKPRPEDEDFFILDAMAEVIEAKGLKPDLSDPKTIDILKGSSGEIVQTAARGLWQERKEKKRAGDREISGGMEIHTASQDRIKIKEEPILPSDKRRSQKRQWSGVNIQEVTRTKKHKGAE